MAPTAAVPRPVEVRRPTSPGEIASVREALNVLGLGKLWSIPWDITTSIYLEDFAEGARVEDSAPNTVRGKPDTWTVDFVGNAFKCPAFGVKNLSQRDTTGNSYFDGGKDPSHGWKISQCNDTTLRLLLRFMMPIFHPKKPTYCTSTMANTIVAAWKNNLAVNWARLLTDVIMANVKSLQPGKPSPLPSYLAQLYKWGDCLYTHEIEEQNQKRQALRDEEEEDTEDEGESEAGEEEEATGEPEEEEPYRGNPEDLEVEESSEEEEDSLRRRRV